MNELVSPTPKKEKRPVAGEIREDESWYFSFKYFNQAKFFGLGNVDGDWYLSLINRLKELAITDRSELDNKYATKKHNRYHEIDWNGSSVPCKRSDFNWVDKNVLENEIEFPFHQFHISKALGRIVGFWGENNRVFYIVALDRYHNMQPSLKYNYKVTKTSIGDCQFTGILKDINALGNLCCKRDCQLLNEIKDIPKKYISNETCYYIIDSEFKELLSEKLKSRDLTEIVLNGIIHEN